MSWRVHWDGSAALVIPCDRPADNKTANPKREVHKDPMMYEFGADQSPFGHWGNLEERVQELANRLHAWYLSGDQLPELFVEAQRKMADALSQYDDPMDAPKEILFEAFEETLDQFDHILMTFPQSIEGWCENGE